MMRVEKVVQSRQLLLTALLACSLAALGSLLAATSVCAQGEPINLALAGVSNESGYAPETLSAQAEEALRAAFAKTPGFTLADPTAVSAATKGITAAQLTSPEGLAAVAAVVGADAAVFARVLEVQAKADSAKVILETLWAQPNAETFRLRTRVAGATPAHPQIKDGVSALVDEALRAACETTATEAAGTIALGGAIVAGDVPSVGLGQGAGVRPGAELVVLRDRRAVARLEVVSVATTYSDCKIIEGTARARLRSGDAVRVVYNPSLSLSGPPKAIKRPFISKEGWITLLVGGLLWYLSDQAKHDGGAAVSVASIQFAGPSTLIADGVSQIELLITVTDNQGNPVPDGTLVYCTLSTTEGDVTNKGSITSPMPTTGGVARAILTAGTEPKDVVVTARVGNLTQTRTIKYLAGQTGAVAGPPEAATLSASVPAVQANGNDFSTITAHVVDATGAPVTNGTLVHFSAFVTVVEPGGTTDTEDTTITPTATTSAGSATAILISRDPTTNLANRAGSVTVTVTVDPVQTAPIPSPLHPVTNSAALVQYVSQSVADIALGANPTNIRGLDWVGKTSTIGAVVFDTVHNPVVDGTAVYFTSDRGLIYGGAGSVGGVAVSITKNGQASATLVSAADGISDLTFNGEVTVRATAGGPPGALGVVTAETMVIFSGPATTADSILQLSDTQMASVKDSIIITVVAHDRNDQPVIDGTSIKISADKGDLDNTQLTTTGGLAQTVLRSSSGASGAPPTATGPGVIEVTIETGGVPVRLTGNYTVVP
jgi:hypothetical protein